MDRKLGKEKMKPSESAPMPTKGRKDADFRNQTTNVPTTRFPWTTIMVVVALILIIAIVVAFLELGSS